MKSTLEQIHDSVSRAFESDDAYSSAEAALIAAEAVRAVERAQRLFDDYKNWSGGWPPCDFNEVNTYVAANYPDLGVENVRSLLIDWGKAEGNFR